MNDLVPETRRFQRLADAIGETLESVCNLNEKERTQLLLACGISEDEKEVDIKVDISEPEPENGTQGHTSSGTRIPTKRKVYPVRSSRAKTRVLGPILDTTEDTDDDIPLLQTKKQEPDDEIEILNVVASPSRSDSSRPGPYRPYTSPQPGPSRSYLSPKPGPSRSYPSSHSGPSRTHPIPQSPDIPSPSQPSSSFLPPKKRLSNSILPDSQSLGHSAQSPIRNTQSPILNVQSAQLESQSLLHKIQSPHLPSDNHDNLLDSPLGLDEDLYQLPDIPDPVNQNSYKASRSSTPSIRDDSKSPDLENYDSGLKENTEIEEHLLDYVFKNSNNQFNDKDILKCWFANPCRPLSEQLDRCKKLEESKLEKIPELKVENEGDFENDYETNFGDIDLYYEALSSVGKSAMEDRISILPNLERLSLLLSAEPRFKPNQGWIQLQVSEKGSKFGNLFVSDEENPSTRQSVSPVSGFERLRRTSGKKKVKDVSSSGEEFESDSSDWEKKKVNKPSRGRGRGRGRGK
ncbi:probable serine/threonine-protein kinase samkC [Eurytemora carolleeae]|uniref:probable serine/threonine-protein kinase samkC n=1 Tax=Eurytemora carolleeae TaxID=1294199 RepID=UPI000C78B537|nr:probable serine/threonine-protein kinase samkC [Eurytemora carolleeae]|eukprot:XP_023328135.1 probable serine/threonine-protein kinase samkC [Eurytemora affinis]